VWHNGRLNGKRYLPDLWIAAAIFAGNLLILGPYLFTDFSSEPWNNGYIYIAIARMFRDHPWTWDPLHYAGAPFRYLYPPIFHVLIGAVPVASLGRAFHLVSGLGYALAPAALYVLALQLFRSRLAAAFAAVAYSVFPSPLYAVLPQWGNLALPYHPPWGFVTFIRYDEAAHTFGLAPMFLSAAAAWRGRWRTAAMLAGAVLLTNWPALIGLGFLIAGIAVARLRDLGPVKAPSYAFGLAGTAYGLAAFWMTPGYFVSSTLLNRVVLRHAPVPAAPWTAETWLILSAAAALIGLALWRRVPQALSFALAWVALSGAVIVSFTLAENALLPSPNRYMLEFNAGTVLLLAALVSLVPGKWRPIAVGAATAAGLMLASGFLAHAWSFEPRPRDPRTGPAWQAADWLNRNNGRSRVLASGELDSTLSLWSDAPQAGGSGQDLSNFLIFAAEREVALGACSAGSDRVAQLWLRALNVKHLVVHHAASRENFHWYAQPERFRAMPVAWDNGAGDTIYRVPDSGASDAVVVDLAALGRLPRLRSTADAAFLEAYVAWAAGKRPASIRWTRDDAADLDATLAPGEAILVKSNYDIGWRVSAGSLAADPIGFLLIRSAPGPQHLALRFGASWDTWLGRAISLLTVVLLFAGVRTARIAALAVIPAVAAYAVLLWTAPPTAAIAEDTFARVAPPIINAGGIVNNGSTVAVWGLNLGGTADKVRVLVGGREAEIVHRDKYVLDIKPPAGLPPHAEISVEVNGCRGNAFTL